MLSQITTIIPTYKRPELLKRTIQSVQNQTYRDILICVYDNASDDETEKVVAELAANDARIRYHRHEKNIGSFSNFQYGLRQVDTPFFSFISDDDLLLPWFYEKAMKALHRHPEAGFFAGSLLYVTSEKKIVKAGIAAEEEEILLPGSAIVERIIEETFPLWTAVLFRKVVRDEIGLLDSEVGPFDVDFMLRASLRFSAIASKTMCALFYRHSSSFSLAPELSFVWPGWKRVIAHLKNEKLPLDLRLKGEKKMLHMVKKMLVLVILTALAKKNYVEAKTASNLLEEIHGRHFSKRAFLALISSCEQTLLFQKSFRFWFKFSFEIRDRIREIPCQKKYKSYLQYL